MTKTAAEIMTHPVVTVSIHTSIAEIATLLADKHISAVPVLENDGTLAGIVSEEDILRPYRASIRSKREFWLSRMAEGEELSPAYLDFLRHDNKSARDVMTKHLVTAEKQTTYYELADLMVSHKVRRIPVVENHRVVGIVSRSDMIRAAARAPAMAV